MQLHEFHHFEGELFQVCSFQDDSQSALVQSAPLQSQSPITAHKTVSQDHALPATIIAPDLSRLK